ncbi:protein kinase [Nocardia sp. NPDC059246]|uniref:serine/threonine-protein kinase n=1 Tax=unclassified Nocardia TaxID=2637762 RepID=UPI003691F256
MGSTLEPGEVFAGYQILRKLGAGGMGAVYQARDRDLPRFVALKLLTLPGGESQHRVRFRREADTVARLQHPNIVTVYARGEEDDRLWISMTFVDGTDVARALRPGAMHPARAVRIIAETAAALDHAHDTGILHRDVKPANILLSDGRPERALLTDFGIAKTLDESRQLTQRGEILASFQYAAPERLTRPGEADRRADVYSLGCTLYHMLTGQPPYPGQNVGQIIYGHAYEAVPVPSERNPGLPRGFDELIARAMAKDPGRRFTTCTQMAWSAQQILRQPAPPLTGPPPATIDLSGPRPAATQPRPAATTLPPAPAPTHPVSTHPPSTPPAPTGTGPTTTVSTRTGPTPMPNRTGPIPAPSRVDPTPAPARTGTTPILAQTSPAPAPAPAPARTESPTGHARTDPTPMPIRSGPAPVSARRAPAPMPTRTESPTGPARIGPPPAPTHPVSEPGPSEWVERDPIGIGIGTPVHGKRGSGLRILMALLLVVALAAVGYLLVRIGDQHQDLTPMATTAPMTTTTSPAVTTTSPVAYAEPTPISQVVIPPVTTPYTSPITSYPPKTIAVPDVVGTAIAQAKAQLEKDGFVVQQAEREDKHAKGTVVGLDPAAGTVKAVGSTVTVYVSTGAATITLPTLTNLTPAAVTTTLQALGWHGTVQQSTVKVTDPAKVGKVVGQNPAAGTAVAVGATVTITVGEIGTSTPVSSSIPITSYSR